MHEVIKGHARRVCSYFSLITCNMIHVGLSASGNILEHNLSGISLFYLLLSLRGNQREYDKIDLILAGFKRLLAHHPFNSPFVNSNYFSLELQ